MRNLLKNQEPAYLVVNMRALLIAVLTLALTLAAIIAAPFIAVVILGVLIYFVTKAILFVVAKAVIEDERQCRDKEGE